MTEDIRSDAHEDPFSVPIMRTIHGHIDYAYYLHEGRRLRAQAWVRAAVKACTACARMIGWVAEGAARKRRGPAARTPASARARRPAAARQCPARS